MTTIVKAADAAQLLSLIPRMLGFTPRQSLVLIPFAGTRSLGVMRFDLPEDDEAVDRVAATVIGMACRVADADVVTIAAYVDEPVGEDGPRRRFIAALQSRADACGLAVNDCLFVAEDGWGRYADGDALRDLADLDLDHPELADLAPHGDQASGAELPDVEPDTPKQVALAMTALETAVGVLCGPDAAACPACADEPDDLDPPTRIDPRALSAVCALDDLPTLFEDMLTWEAEELSVYALATVAWCLTRPSMRDIALIQWCDGMSAGDEALDAQLRWEEGEEYPAHIAMRMWGEGPRPEPTRLLRALDLARHAAASAPTTHRAGALATAGWLSWALGRSTHAEQYARWACEAEPEHGLAEIVRSFVMAAHLPDWAFRRE